MKIDTKGIAMPTMCLRTALLIAAVTSVGLTQSALAADAATDANADAATATAVPGKDSPELQEIVVTGMRASLR